MGSVSYWQTEAGAADAHPLRERITADVAIIGAGITGVSLALWLARAGLRPVVLEAREIAAGASGRNGGFLLGGTAEAYAAARERYGADRARRIWAYSAGNNAQAVELAGELHERGITTGFARNGSLRIALTEAELEEIRQSVALLAGDGWKAELLDRADLPEQLRATYLGALFTRLTPRSSPRASCAESRRSPTRLARCSTITALSPPSPRTPMVYRSRRRKARSLPRRSRWRRTPGLGRAARYLTQSGWHA